MFVSVGLVDCYPALLVLVCGLLCSGAVLLLEVVELRVRECWARRVVSGVVEADLRASVFRGRASAASVGAGVAPIS
jgi:hypothetical protein